MAPWYQKYRLKWPWTPTQVANTDQMFSEIYSAIKELKDDITNIIAAGNSSTTSGDSSVVIINSSDSDDDSSVFGFGGLRIIPGPQGIQGPQGPIGPSRIPNDYQYDSEVDYVQINKNIDSSTLPAISGEVTITTTGNIDDLDFGNVSLIRMNNASLSTIRGLKAGYAGQEVTIVSVGAGQVDLAHQNSNSTAGYRLINFATSGNSSLAAGFGNASYRYDGTTGRWRLVSFNQGNWISVAFTAGDFTAGGSGTWTVESADLLIFRYWLKDRTLTLNLGIASSSIGGTPNSLILVKIPGGFTTAAAIAINTTFLVDNNGILDESGYLYINAAGSTTFNVVKLDGTNWDVATNTVNVFGTAIIEVQ